VRVVWLECWGHWHPVGAEGASVKRIHLTHGDAGTRQADRHALHVETLKMGSSPRAVGAVR
jgi:hypothetical protein